MAVNARLQIKLAPRLISKKEKMPGTQRVEFNYSCIPAPIAMAITKNEYFQWRLSIQ